MPEANAVLRIGLGSAEVTLRAPVALAGWFAGLAKLGSDTQPDPSIEIIALGADKFAVRQAGFCTGALSLGDALASAWEHIAHGLIVGLRDAVAVHAAALRAGGQLILLPGASGAGKSRLSLWYRALGYRLLTDELVSLAEDAGTVMLQSLPRPVILKQRRSLDGLLRPAEAEPMLQAATSVGLVAQLPDEADPAAGEQQTILLVSPKFREGAPLSITPLSTAQTALTLIGNCVNLRNLPDGGLGLIAGLARQMTGIALNYGETAQLNGTLDVLTRQVLLGASRRDVASLCAAFRPQLAVPPAAAPSPGAAPPAGTIPAPTIKKYPRRLTVGMTTFDDYDGVYFTIQAIRMGHPELADALEFVVIDNNPGGLCSEPLSRLAQSVDGCRYIPRGEWSGTAMKNAVFEEASSRFVICLDCHVLLAPGVLGRLLEHFETDQNSRDLIQGPMLTDDLRQMHTHLTPCWSGGMWGVWATDPRAEDAASPCFDIAMQGMGLFACRRDAWVGFHSAFRGFGAEEGYIHEKTRQHGGRTLCAPFLRWTHRFVRPFGVPYRNRWEDRIRNYLIGFDEVGLPTEEMEAHFKALLGAATATRIFEETRAELQLPRRQPPAATLADT